LAGNPEYLAAARAIDAAFPAPPFALAFDRFTPQTHESGFPGGSLGSWETRSDTPGPTTIADDRFATLTLDWEITDRWALESLTSYMRAESRQVTDQDSSEFTFTTTTRSNDWTYTAQELHFMGNHLDGRLRSLLGLWYLEADNWDRFYQWAYWEFAIPNTGPNRGLPGFPGTGGRPALNTAAVDYVRAWGATVGNAAIAGFFPDTFLTQDWLGYAESSEQAAFGELTIDVLERLDVTLGFRFTTDDRGGSAEYVPADAFRPIEPGTIGAGDLYAPGALVFAQDFADLGTISTPRLSLGYQPTDTVYVYASYAEGFTSGEVVNSPLLAEPIVVDPEVVTTRELGLRSDWLGGRLRLNATLFDSRWQGVRVPRNLGLIDPNTGQVTPFAYRSGDGLADTEGLEVEVSYLASERLEVDFALGLLDAEYVDVGDSPPSGLRLGLPLPYAPETSYSLGVRYRLPLGSGAELLMVGNYGWMDEYQRAAPNAEQAKNPDGSNKPEPAYGILNARIIWQPGRGDWQAHVFGTNLTDEWYVNGGNDFGFLLGFDRATVGRPREIGVGFEYTLGR
jgi:outer membrane receptor protein involved in Fe transport